MKKIAALLGVLVVILNLIGCNYDPYADKRPSDYGDSIWICELPSSWFVVDLSIEDYYDPEGEITVDGVIYRCKLYFIHQTNQVCIDVLSPAKSNKKMGEIWGECTFSEKSLIIYINHERDTIYNGKYETISFFRQDITSN